jgi:hypothetical protein
VVDEKKKGHYRASFEAIYRPRWRFWSRGKSKTLPLTVRTVEVEISWGSPIAKAIVDHLPYPMVSNVVAIAGNGNPPTSPMVPSFQTFHSPQLGQLMVCSSPWQKTIKLGNMLSVAVLPCAPYVSVDMICLGL